MLVAGRKQTFADMTGEHGGPHTTRTWQAMFDAAPNLAMEAARPPTDVSTDGLVDLSPANLDALQSYLADENEHEAYDVVRALRAQNEALQRSNAEKDERELKLLRDIERLVVQRAEKDEALRFYAEQWEQDVDGELTANGWVGSIGDIVMTEALRNDCGDIARKALSHSNDGGTDAVHQ